jgi:hypothetical protein
MIKKILLSMLLAVSSYSYAEPIITDSTSKSTSTSVSETTVKSPPPSAAPAITSINSDLCTVGVSAAVQTQILGFSSGMTTRDMNCERLKLSKTLYDMGMKVAAVASLCQDERVYLAMLDAGTPCPIDGKIGEAARQAWEDNPQRKPGTLKSQKVGTNEKDSSDSTGNWFTNLFRSAD